MRLFILALLSLFFTTSSFAQCEDFVVDTLVFHPTCHGFSDGSISFEISGGTGPYEVFITDEDGIIFEPPMGGTINTLSAGCYYAYVEDAEGCVYEDTICLIDGGPIEVELEIINPSAPDLCDGAILIDTVYGLCGEEYSCFWSPDPGAVDCDLIDICPGDYLLTINDECGCSVVVDAFLPGSLSGINDETVQENQVSVANQNGLLYLNTIQNEAIRIDFYDTTGKKVNQTQVLAGEQEVNCSLESGLLIYLIYDSNGSVIGQGKVMR